MFEKDDIFAQNRYKFFYFRNNIIKTKKKT
jgi:hypothetical protein